MSNKKQKRCLVSTAQGETEGTIIKEYEEAGGPNDGAIFTIIELDNGQTITVMISETLGD